MSEITYRDATPADARALAAIGRDTFLQTFGALYRADDLAAFLADNHSPEAARRFLADPAAAFRLVEDANGLAGYAMLAPDTLPFADPGHRAIEIKRFYLLAHLHGRGAADTLMDWALANARAARYDGVSLSVFSDNHRAKRFYARHGFEEVGRYVFMVGKQADDERVWRRSLA